MPGISPINKEFSVYLVGIIVDIVGLSRRI